jgi:uncharacterized protein (TIGR02421 family)
VIIGKRDLSGFLLDVGKREVKTAARSSVKIDMRAVDSALSEIDQQLILLKYLRPMNLREERQRLAEDKLYNPMFEFREIELDLDDLTKRIDAEHTDDSPLGILLGKKRKEMLHKINLLRARGDAKRFTDASQLLYGYPSAALIGSAAAFLRAQTACDLPPPDSELLSAEDAVPMFEEVIQKYGLHDWQVRVRENMVSDCATGGKRLYLRSGAWFSREHIAALIAHEIETHALTSENGSYQPFALFRRGFAGYLDTQEGLAIYNQNRMLSPHHEKRYGHARSVLGIAYALEHSFAQTRTYLERELHYQSDKALTKAIELKRGFSDTSQPGAFTKSLVYFRGLLAVERFIDEGGDIQRLYVGKIALEDLALAEQVPGLREPLVVPSFLTGTATESGETPEPAKNGGKQRDVEEDDTHAVE